MGTVKNLLIFAAILAALAAGAGAVRQTPSNLGPEETALDFARLYLSLSPEVYGLTSPNKGGELRSRLQRDFVRARALGNSPPAVDAGNLTALTRSREGSEAAVDVFGTVTLGRNESEKKGWKVRFQILLVEEPLGWRVR